MGRSSHLDPGADLRRQRAEPALDGAPVAPVEHLDHAPAVQVRDDGGQLAAAAVMGLIERQPARPAVAATRLALVGALGERAGYLVAARAFLARDSACAAPSATRSASRARKRPVTR
jgi:energy-converting hydrogenase Eha subunit B